MSIPSYFESTLNDDVPSINDNTTLPAYSGHRPSQREGRATPLRPRDFTYKIEKNDHIWANMTITADEKLSKNIPTFVEGEPILGQVELWTEKGGEDIRGVVVSMIGEVIMGASKGERFTFLDVSETLWSQDMGDPRTHQLDTASSRSTEQSDGPHSHKLFGNFVWKFQLKFPKEVSLRNGKEVGTYSLLQTQSERHTRACVRYEVIVCFVRGKLRSDNKIGAIVGYIPISYPLPFSPLRQLAYQEGLSNLLGPTVDPEGWHSEEPIRIKGKIFNNREIDISCQVSNLIYLLTPFTCHYLSYTRGTTVPLCLTLKGSDIQALDLLSNPKAPVVRLRRRVRYTVNVEKDLRNVVTVAWRDSVAHSKAAVWWHAPEQLQADSLHEGQRTINGELHLKTELKPTSAMGQFRTEYSVVLFPFDVAGFESFANEALQEQPVDIVTAYAAGPRPRMLIPPGYDNDESLHALEQTNIVSEHNTGLL
ncbi:hypothetical protein BJ165DRAFT_1343134 [Panaeolus papilionaceus]|nr:hypothetical protein BJ165DRAFT_1343134 [Panaeolus papilionaceus]